MSTEQTARRPWTEDDKRRLIGLWESLGSIVLISVLLDRPEGSVQTEASRLNLPRRLEDRGQHRKKWTDEQDDILRRAVDACRDGNGRIRIVEVADKVGRSVDAVVSRLAEQFDSRAALKSAIAIPEPEEIERAQERAQEQASRFRLTDTRKQPKTRKCLTCDKPFWSEGAHNRICPRCSTEEESDWD